MIVSIGAFEVFPDGSQTQNQSPSIGIDCLSIAPIAIRSLDCQTPDLPMGDRYLLKFFNSDGNRSLNDHTGEVVYVKP